MPWQKPLPPHDPEEYFMFEDPFRWPFMKFEGLHPDDLFGRLHDRFNTAPMSILDRTAWHADVIDSIRISDTIEEFYAQLGARRTKRLAELVTVINSVEHLTWTDWSPMPHFHLGLAMSKLHLNASMYDAAQSFLAMAEFVKGRLEEWEREPLAPNEWLQDWQRAQEQETTKAQRASIDTQNSMARSQWAPPSPHEQSKPCSTDQVSEHLTSQTPIQTPNETHEQAPRQTTSSNKKRRRDEGDGLSNPLKKPRATTPQSSPRASPTNKDAIPSDDKTAASGQETSCTQIESSSSCGASPASTDHSTSAATHQVPAPDNDLDTCSPPLQTVGALTTEPDIYDTVYEEPESWGRMPQYLCETQYPPTRIDYEGLGWQHGSSSPAALTGGGDHSSKENIPESPISSGRPVLQS